MVLRQLGTLKYGLYVGSYLTSVLNFLGVDNSEVIWEDVLFSGDVAGVSRGSVSRYVCVNKAGATQVGPVSI